MSSHKKNPSLYLVRDKFLYMSHLKFFKNISKHDVASAGGKGASLGELTQAGIPVPPGFVILASAFDRFGDTSKVKAAYDGFTPLRPEDIAEAIYFAISRPPNVTINDLDIMPTAQAASGVIFKKG